MQQPAQSRLLRLLLVEDRPEDGELVVEYLRAAGFAVDCQRVDVERDFARQLETDPLPDLVLSDYHLPRFSAERALELLQQRAPDIPFILISGAIGEEAAAAVMRAGARDFVPKRNLSRLAPAVERELLAAAERRAARASQEEYVARLRGIFESALDALVTMNEDGKISDWNPRAEAIFGWPKSEVVGRVLAETIIPQRYREAHWAGLRRFLKSEEGAVLNKRLEIEALHRDGHEFPVELSITFAKSGTGYVFSGFLRDISERRRAEEVVRRLAAIVESSDDAIYSVSTDWTILSWNAAAERIFGYPAEEAVGQNAGILIPPTPADELERYRQRLASGIRMPPFETVRLRKGGQPIDVSLTVSPIKDADGRLIAFSVIARDIGESKQAERALAASEERYRQIVETAFEGVWIIDESDRTTYVNRRMAEMLGYSTEEMIGKPVVAFMDAEGQAAFRVNLDLRRQGFQPEHDFRFTRKDGSEVWTLLEATPIKDEAGHYRGSLAMLTDVTERRRAEHALREQTSLYEALVKAQGELGQVIILWDGNRPIYINEAFSRITGYQMNELEQMGSLFDIVAPELQDGRPPDLIQRLEGRKARTFETTIVAKDGRRIDLEGTDMRFEAGGRTLIFTLARDITERKQAQDALRYQALHDALTRLPNRVFLSERMTQALETARTASHSCALLMLDLDHFKEVNETFGHQAGDRLLEQVGPRLIGVLDRAATVARLGGDEFAVLLPEAERGDAMAVSAKLLEALDRPFEVEGQLFDIAASIGIATFPADGDNPDGLLRRADIALFVAKRSRGAYVSYAPSQEKQGASRLTLMAELRQAIHEDQLFLHYQPLVSLRDGTLHGVEALVRWRHPERGLVPPAEFIPFAERTRLIQPLTRWALAKALEQCREWHAGGRTIPVAINISMRDVIDPEFPDVIASTLHQVQAQAAWLRLEITEGVIMAEPERAIETLGRIRKLGVRLAVDDFGTGYSSLAYLHRLPIQELKIDRSFVSQITRGSSGANIVRAAVDLGHSLRLETVAEGIEDERTWDLLAALGCDLAQGYYIGRPLAAEELMLWISKWQAGRFRESRASDPGRDAAA